MTVKILMIDDHPGMIEGYKAMLSLNKEQHIIETTVAYNCGRSLRNNYKF